MQINTKNYLILSLIALAGVFFLTQIIFFIQNILATQQTPLAFFILLVLFVLSIIFGSAIKFFLTAIKKNIKHPFKLLFT